MATPVTPTRTRTRFDDDEAEGGIPTVDDEVVEEVPVVVESDHTPILHTAANLPKATGSIPPTFTITTFANQRDTAMELFTFLRSPNPQLLKLNEGATVYTALVSIPRSKLVKLVFCPGMGSSPIGAASSPIDEKLLFLHGDGSDELGPPSPLCLQTTVVASAEVNVMTEEQCLTALTAKGAEYTYPPLATEPGHNDRHDHAGCPNPTIFRL